MPSSRESASKFEDAKHLGRRSQFIFQEAGTSLLEVITVAALAVVVTFAIYSLIDSIGPIQIDVQHRTDLAGEARLTTDAVAKEVRARKTFFNDQFGTMDADHLQLVANRSGGTNPRIYYFVDPIISEPGKYQLSVYTCGVVPCDPTNPAADDSLHVLSDNIVNGNSVSDPVFTFFLRNASGDQEEIFNADNRPSGTRWVRIHLILDDNPSDTKRRVEIEEDVAIRNN